MYAVFSWGWVREGETRRGEADVVDRDAWLARNWRMPVLVKDTGDRQFERMSLRDKHSLS